jgi:hypothetical protein
MLVALAVANTILQPLIPYLLSDQRYMAGFKVQIVLNSLLLLLALTGWYFVWPFATKVLHLDKRGDLPWYASPLVWFTPIFLVIMYLMFAQ